MTKNEKVLKRVSADVYAEAVAVKDMYKTALEMAVYDLLPQCARIPMCGKCPASKGFCKKHIGPICDKVLFDYFVRKAKEETK